MKDKTMARTRRFFITKELDDMVLKEVSGCKARGISRTVSDIIRDALSLYFFGTPVGANPQPRRTPAKTSRQAILSRFLNR